MGRHKDVKCTECGQRFTVSATEEPVAFAVCPNCRFRNDVRDEPVFKGDRILVLKSLYDLPGWMPEPLREPKRWDVVVFKFPEEPQINYIKRLVGLPEEELRIHYGNVYARVRDEGDFKILKKSPEKQRVMRMLVFDNNHQPATWHDNGWPARWQPDDSGDWRASQDGKSFESSAEASNGNRWSELSYRHLVRVWSADETNKAPDREQLITDFYAYNSGMSEAMFQPFEGEQHPHWVGDLSLSFSADVREAHGKLRVELVKAGERFACEFDLASGECRLLHNEQVLARAAHVIGRTGKYPITFSNMDDRLTVTVGKQLPFGDGLDYDGPGLEDSQLPTAADLRPVTVAEQGAQVRVSDLVLYRDIYYTHNANDPEYVGLGSGDWEQTLSNPELWQAIAQARISAFGRLGPDDFMMLGDNSPRSKDGRLWDQGAGKWLDEIARDYHQPPNTVREEIAERPGGDVVNAAPHVVRRQLLIGKAFFVYWPHGVPFGPRALQVDVPLGPLGKYRVPFYPNVTRMKKIQ